MSIALRKSGRNLKTGGIGFCTMRVYYSQFYLIKLSMETEDRRRMNLPGSAHTEINHGNRGCSVVCGDFEKQTVGFGRNDFYLPSGYG